MSTEEHILCFYKKGLETAAQRKAPGWKQEVSAQSSGQERQVTGSWSWSRAGTMARLVQWCESWRWGHLHYIAVVARSWLGVEGEGPTGKGILHEDL